MSRMTRQVAFLALLSLTAVPVLLGGCSDSRDTGEGTVISKSGQIEVEPAATLEFSSPIVGQVQAKMVSITNTGEGELLIRRIRLSENDRIKEFGLSYEVPRVHGEKMPDFADYDDAEACPPTDNFKLYPEGEGRRFYCLVWLVYTATDSSPDSGSLTVNSDDTTREEWIVTLSTGESEPELTATPDPITFNDVEEGTEATAELTLFNSGKSNLVISRISLPNDGDGQFSWEISQTKGTVHEIGSGAVLAPAVSIEDRDEMVVLVHYSPTRVGNQTGRLRIESNDPNAAQRDIEIHARSIKPCIQVTPADADFGDVQIGSTKDLSLDLSNCGNAPLIITEASFVEEGTSLDFSILSAPEGLTCNENDRSCTGEVAIAPQATAAVILRYAPGEEGPDGGMLMLHTNVAKKEELSINLFGKGTTNTCPTAVAEARVLGADVWDEFPDDARRLETIPLKTLELRGDRSSDPDGSIASYKWTVLERPEDSTAQLAPHEASPEPTFYLDLAGRYVFELQVVDDRGLPSCRPGLVVVVAIPDEDIHIQLVWDTPADPDQTDEGFAAGSDLDLHMLHPLGEWFDQPYDCYFANSNPDWGRPANGSDDPSLDRDDTDGAGPENINLNNPENNKIYRIGVHYFNDHGYGASFVTVRIYIEGIVRFELPNKRMAATDYFWDVATISWPGGAVTQIDQLMASAPNGGGH